MCLKVSASADIDTLKRLVPFTKGMREGCCKMFLCWVSYSLERVSQFCSSTWNLLGIRQCTNVFTYLLLSTPVLDKSETVTALAKWRSNIYYTNQGFILATEIVTIACTLSGMWFATMFGGYVCGCSVERAQCWPSALKP